MARTLINVIPRFRTTLSIARTYPDNSPSRIAPEQPAQSTAPFDGPPQEVVMNSRSESSVPIGRCVTSNARSAFEARTPRRSWPLRALRARNVESSAHGSGGEPLFIWLLQASPTALATRAMRKRRFISRLVEQGTRRSGLRQSFCRATGDRRQNLYAAGDLSARHVRSITISPSR